MALTRRQFMKGGLMAAGIVAASGFDAAANEQRLFPEHPPLGVGQGINPGRVVWMHDPAAVRWDGAGGWWQTDNFDFDRILQMTRKGLMGLTGKNSAPAAWQALFEFRNAKNGKSGGYKPGQKIAVKPNMNGAGQFDDESQDNFDESYANAVLLKALLVSLVTDGGARPEDIVVYDACRIFPKSMRKMCTEGQLAGVGFRYRDPGGPNDAGADKEARINWAGPIEGAPAYLPKCVTDADYMINLANLKGHCWGMTLTGKNHFGSFVNSERKLTPGAAGLHPNVIGAKPGDYSAIADLMARKELGGKTVLWMLDGLITAPGEITAITPENSRWEMEPFNGHYASSLFFSQDPVALDSVGADFLVNEPVMRRNNSNMTSNRGMENYLHEASQIANPPSKTKYTDGNGGKLASLGAHEHWNNPAEKLYSRNRGASEGIELLKNPE